MVAHFFTMIYSVLIVLLKRFDCHASPSCEIMHPPWLLTFELWAVKKPDGPSPLLLRWCGKNDWSDNTTVFHLFSAHHSRTWALTAQHCSWTPSVCQHFHGKVKSPLIENNVAVFLTCSNDCIKFVECNFQPLELHNFPFKSICW